MDAKSASVKVLWFMAVLAAALAASLLCGVQQAHAVESIQYVEKSWDADSKQVVSTPKTVQAAALTSDTEYINGWCYVSGTIEGSKRLTVMEGQEANIILTDGSKLTLEKGINVHHTSKLNIYAQQGETGELICYADTNKENAPIGSDNNSGPNGSITIHGGKITANNDNNEAHAAGIGAGKTGAGGTITIYGGTIEARGGNGSAGIGGGDAYGPGRDGGTITIYGGDVKAYGGGGAAGIGGGRGGNGGAITIWGGKVYAKGGPQSSYTFPNDSGAGIGSGDDDAGSTATTGGTISIYGGEVEAVGGPDAAGIGGGDGCIGGFITITGGTVKATGGNCASGIGAGDDTDGRVNASTINITGGTIEATGGKNGAGIGGGEGGGGGIINISGGAVTASAGSDGAGIGGGYGGNGDSVNISGGTVVATGNAGGAGIGGGDGGAGTNIIISGGTVEAIGGANGSGIGNGKGGTGMATTVTLKYAEDEYDISVKATSYRCNNEDTSVTLTMENPFTDKGTREPFEATSYTAGNLDTLNNKILVRASTFGVAVSEAQGGSVVVGKSRAVPGSTVTLTVAPDAGDWELKPGTLKAKAGETELALTQDTSDSSKYTFTMPAADVTVTAEFVKKVAMVTLTLIGSSIDGEDVYEPFVAQVPKGSSLADFYTERLTEAYKHFRADDSQYRYYGMFRSMTKPLAEYSSWQEVSAEDTALVESMKFDENTTLYVALAKYVDTIALSVERPACGTEVRVVEDLITGLPKQENAPKITVGEDTHMPIADKKMNPKWLAPDSEFYEPFEGIIEAGRTYSATVELGVPDFGYTFDSDRRPEKITVDGAVAESVHYDGTYEVAFDVVALDHEWGEATYTWAADNSTVTATHACSACGEKATETAAVATKVTKATFAAAGKIALTAAFKDPAFEAQTKSTAIPKLTVGGVADRAYTGKAVTQSPVVKSGNRVLKAGTDYTLSYKNNVKPGTATVTVTAKGANYAGSTSLAFAIRSWKRLAGPTALDTMEQITKEFGKATTAVVTTNALASASNDAGYKDALAAAALAGGFNAPMLTTSKGGLSDKTRSELKRMGVKKVYVVGSTREVASKVDSQIRAMGITVVRVAGTPAAAMASGKAVTSTAGGASTATASERAVACAKLVKGRSDTVIVATQNNFKDALAISSYAYATKSPILYAEAGKAPKLSRATLDYIKSAKFGKAIVVGGPVSLPKDVETQLKSAGIAANSITRLAGSNQYKTARVIAEWATGKLKNGTGGGTGLYQYASVKFQPAVKLTADRLGVARADDNKIGWKDAPAGAALCGKNKSVVLLADAVNDGHAAAFVKASKAQITYGYVFGGTLAVPKASMDKLVQASL